MAYAPHIKDSEWVSKTMNGMLEQARHFENEHAQRRAAAARLDSHVCVIHANRIAPTDDDFVQNYPIRAYKYNKSDASYVALNEQNIEVEVNPHDKKIWQKF